MIDDFGKERSRRLFDVGLLWQNIAFHACVRDDPEVTFFFSKAILQHDGIGIELLLEFGEFGGFWILEIGVGGAFGTNRIFEVVAIGVEFGDFVRERLGIATRFVGQLNQLEFFGI